LVTGGARGIGEAIVRKFYHDGATVFVLDRNQSLLDDLKKQLPKIQTICVDILDWQATQAAVWAITPLDHLVNNAGIFQGGSLLSISGEAMDQVMAVNVKGTVCVTQAFVNGNVKAGTEKGTTIVNMSSMADRISLWGGVAYCASKAAITSVTKTMALEFGDMGIRVNAVSPVFIGTELVKAIDPEILGKAVPVMERTLLKERALETDDVANSVLFLSSPLSAMMTGTSLVLDAGTHAH